jgi:hypothetical protein
MLTKIKNHAIAALCGALVIVALNSTGNVINVTIWRPMPLVDLIELGNQK